MQVELNKKVDNPFYGLNYCLELYQEAGKGIFNPTLLGAAWKQVKNDEEKKKMFFSLLISIGDITARQHNIFKGNKKDSGGNAQREVFMNIFNWMKYNIPNETIKLLTSNIINEYISFDILFANRVITKKNQVKNYYSFTGSTKYMTALLDYCTSIIQSNNPVNKYFLAKFLTIPRLSKRSKHKKMLPQTKELMRNKENFLKKLSLKVGFETIDYKNHTSFPGYINWRKEFNGELESVLFSSRKILDFDEQQFLGWLDKLPSGARFRVRCRLLTSDNKPKIKEGEEVSKWYKLPEWFLKWENFKNTKQTEQRVLEEKVRQGVASEKEVKKLEVVKKEVKVNVGAFNFKQEFSNIIKGTIDKIKVQPFLDKINLPYNTLVFMDDSGSMSSSITEGFTAFDFATFIATICLMKNPEDSGRSLLGMFSRETRLFNMMTARTEFVNSLVKGKTKKVQENLINPELHFLDNLNRMRQFAASQRTGNLTNISTIPAYLEAICKDNPQVLEQLQDFPVWTIISDGNFNNMHSPEASINDMLRECEILLGFKPFIIAIDVANNSSAIASRFSGIDNFMFIPPNPAQIEQLLLNFKDMDVYDAYTPLLSLYRSNRYELVREAISQRTYAYLE